MFLEDGGDNLLEEERIDSWGFCHYLSGSAGRKDWIDATNSERLPSCAGVSEGEV